MASTVLAVILNWNELEITRRCVLSLVSQKHVNLDILVVDNYSTDDPSATLKTEFPEILVVRNFDNLGVAGGRNVGIRYGIEKGYEYILLFDNDAHADSEMLLNLTDMACKNPYAGIFGPKILRDDEPEVIWRAGCTSWKWTYLHAGCEILRRAFKMLHKHPPPFLDTIRGVDQYDEGQYDSERDISFQIGCAQLIRTEVFLQVGLLDEEFSPYGSEDIDFCARATKAGWRIRYVPKAKCWHRVGGSFRDEYQRNYYNHKHLILLARKNLTPIYFWLLFFPDFFFLKIPLMIIDSNVKKTPMCRKAIIDAIIWNLKDVSIRGVFINNKLHMKIQKADCDLF